MSNSSYSYEERPIGRQLNRFGRWIIALNTILGITQEDLAMRMDYTKGSFSVATRSGGTMSRKTFQELLKVYRTLAGKKGVWLPITWPIFLTAAWLSIDDGEAYADFFVKGEEQALASIEMVAAIKRERDLLQKENDRLKKKPFRSELLTEIEALEKENERLRLEVAWFRNAENS